MYHQDWNVGMLQHMTRHAAENRLPEAVVRIGAHDDHGCVRRRGTVHQRLADIGVISFDVQLFRLNAVPGKMLQKPESGRYRTLVLGGREDRDLFGLPQQRHRAIDGSGGLQGAVPGDDDMVKYRLPDGGRRHERRASGVEDGCREGLFGDDLIGIGPGDDCKVAEPADFDHGRGDGADPLVPGRGGARCRYLIVRGQQSVSCPPSLESLECRRLSKLSLRFDRFRDNARSRDHFGNHRRRYDRIRQGKDDIGVRLELQGEIRRHLELRLERNALKQGNEDIPYGHDCTRLKTKAAVPNCSDGNFPAIEMCQIAAMRVAVRLERPLSEIIMNPRPLGFGFACTLAILTAAGSSLAKGPDAGRTLAIEACSACHQVIPQQKRPGPVSEGEEGAWTEAPTFSEIANRCLSASELKSRISNPHYPMREQILMPIDVDDLAIYIRTLAKRSDCAIR